MSARTLRPQRGFALPLVVWTIGILALLITALLGEARREVRLTETLKAQAIGRAAADGMISRVMLELLASHAAGSGPRRFGTIPVEIKLTDLSGRINPNFVSDKMLQSLMLRLGAAQNQAQSLAAAIVDWRSPGLKARPHGAKATEYRAAGLSYGPPGRFFESLDELGYVLGMNTWLLAAMKPHMTLWSSGDPDPAFADTAVLGALRDAGAPVTPGSNSGPRVIAITAIARLADAPTVTRRAVVRFGYSPDGRAWRVLEWNDAEAEP